MSNNMFKAELEGSFGKVHQSVIKKMKREKGRKLNCSLMGCLVSGVIKARVLDVCENGKAEKITVLILDGSKAMITVDTEKAIRKFTGGNRK